jgi:hypothetical protein
MGDWDIGSDTTALRMLLKEQDAINVIANGAKRSAEIRFFVADRHAEKHRLAMT